MYIALSELTDILSLICEVTSTVILAITLFISINNKKK